jgi:DNA gyrase subunit B
MWVGGTGAFGLQNLVMEIVANSFDQALAGAADAITVAIDAENVVSVTDNGAGFSTEVGPDGRTFLERVCTERHDTPTADGHVPHVHAASFGLGIFPICALSEFLEVETSDGTRTVRQRFAAGRTVSAIETVDPADGIVGSGTVVRFRPDPAIFGAQPLPIQVISDALTTLGCLIPGVEVTLVAEQVIGPTTDIRSLYAATWPAGADTSTPAPVLVEHTNEVGRVEIALTFGRPSHTKEPTIRSFCNHRETYGGTHEEGIAEGIRRVFGDKGDEMLTRLTAVMHVTLSDPVFAGPTMGTLDSPEAIELVAEAFAEQLPGLVETI